MCVIFSTHTESAESMNMTLLYPLTKCLGLYRDSPSIAQYFVEIGTGFSVDQFPVRSPCLAGGQASSIHKV